MDMTKTCPGCGLTKPREAYYGNAHRQSKLSDACKDCTIERQRRLYKADPEASRASARERMRKYRERQKAQKQNTPAAA